MDKATLAVDTDGIVRALGPGDEGVLDRVAPDVFDDPIDAEAAKAFLADPRHHIVVALRDGWVVGFASGVDYLHPDKAHPELWINEIGVAGPHQRQGIARLLMHAILVEGNKRGCKEAWVLTDRDNEAAMGLYASVAGASAPSDQVMFGFKMGFSV